MERTRLVEFVENDYARVLAALSQACGDRDRAEDAVQEALARAYDRGDEIADLPAWVARVALNQVRSHMRHLAAEGRALERMGRRSRLGRPLPVQGEPRPVLDEALATELGRLPVGQRQVVVLHYLLDMGVAEVASLLGVHEGTVKTQLHRARNSLRDRIEDERATSEEAEHVQDC